MNEDSRKELKPRRKGEKPNLELLDYDAEEPIAEKLSIGMPTQSRLHPPSLTSYVGQRVRILLRDGSVIVGILQRRLWNYVHLLNVEETGKDFTLTADWCDVELGTIARVYPANAKVEKISKA